MLVVGDEGFLSKIDKSRKLRTAERRVPRVQIISEETFCRRAGLLTAGDLKRYLYPLRDIQKLYPELREDRVQYLEAHGLVFPQVKTNAERFYDFTTLWCSVTLIRSSRTGGRCGRSSRACGSSTLASLLSTSRRGSPRRAS
jgi:hypothetical protein